MRLVKQKQSHGCYIAALAMIAGLSYDEIKAHFNKSYDFDKEGVTFFAADALLHKLGFASARIWQHDQLNKEERSYWPPSPWADVHLCEAVVDPKKGAHAIIMLKDGKVLDPNFGELPSLRNPHYVRVYSVAAIYKVKELANAV